MFYYEQIDMRYSAQIVKILEEINQSPIELNYRVVVDKNSRTEENRGFKQSAGQTKPDEGRSETDSYSGQFHLNKENTFDTFIEGNCNQLGRAAGLAIAEKPGVSSFNPFIVYGGVGLGKTHLVQAIGNRVKEFHPHKRIVYIATEKFTSNFIDALKRHEVNRFTKAFFAADVLIMDDIQFLAKKQQTQDMFFQIFNDLHQNSKQIIMTSDCPPKDLKDMPERLLTRFRWGLQADLHQPEFETRVAIIKKKLDREGVMFPEEVIELVAETVETNVRDLEGVVIQLIARTTFNSEAISIDLTKRILSELINAEENSISPEKIKETVAAHFQIDPELLTSSSRKQNVAVTRHFAIFFTKELTDFSLSKIGKIFGGRDHSTVINSIQKAEDLIKTNVSYRNAHEALKRKFRIK